MFRALSRPSRLHAALLVLAAALLAPPAAVAQEAVQEETVDYWSPQREMIRRGQQAILTCNGLFTSHRTLEQVYQRELAFFVDPGPVGTPEGGAYEVDRDRRAVAIGDPLTGPVMRAAFRDGIGCVIMAPDQDFDDIDGLPVLRTPPPPGDQATIAWPDGDLVDGAPDDAGTAGSAWTAGLDGVPAAPGIDPAALRTASDWAFHRESPYQYTISLMVVHDGRIVHERYAPGFDMHTRTRTWSTAKSIAATLIGILVDDGRLALDEPLELDWLPEARSPETDPRDAVTLRHVLHMSSGLYPIDYGGLEYATGSGLGYWAGASSVRLALDRGLIREPGTRWDYENSETLLAVRKMREALCEDAGAGRGDSDRATAGAPATAHAGAPCAAYHAFPRRALLDRIGMRNTLLSTDRFGDFVLSSQVYTSARDLARFGLLYANGGTWHDQRIISEEWIDFVRTPAPATAGRGSFYGAQFWLVPDSRDDVPADAYSTAGNRGQYVIIDPAHDLVIVRRGLDWGRQGFDRWDLLREVLEAVR
jgi:CubicO group peptidase (beta-lactamase class C family)